MDDFNLFSQRDRQDISYGACVGGSVLLGAAIGRFGALPGLLSGAATGLVVGLLACKKLSPAIEKKIFSETDQLTDAELLSVLRIIRDQTGVRTKSEAMYLFSQIRAAAGAGGENMRASSNVSVSPRLAASQLLSCRV